MIRRGLTSPTNIEKPRPSVDLKAGKRVPKVPPPPPPAPPPRLWEPERPLIDRADPNGLTYRATDIDLEWANQLNHYVQRIAASALADPELFYHDGIAVIHLRQAVGFLKAMARRLGKLLSAPDGAALPHYGEPELFVRTIYADPGDGHRFHEWWAVQLGDFVREVEAHGIEDMHPLGAAICFIEAQASLLETYAATSPPERAGEAIRSSRAERFRR